MFAKKLRSLKILLILMLTVPLLLTACSGSDKTKPNTPVPTAQIKEASDQFVQALIDKNYSKAYSLTSPHYQKTVPQAQLQKAFEEFTAKWRNLKLNTAGSDYKFPGDGPYDTYIAIDFVYADDSNYSEHDAIGLNLIEDNGKILVNDVEFAARQD